ncbi:hypothetical protein AVEN_141962-1 [Araneus ventricosus]|uniref:Uncharacterized protein n=1 Tax=Araneus ventricosus TaxID=182803 RepID=A0A4Y2WD02_ARAVE|nr:hypothetical protein AVEN_141962-1 [Araneus ventricosus]
MAFLLARRKEDLMTLAADLDLTFEASFTKLKLKELIVKSPDYVEDDVKKMLDGIVEERTKGEEKAEKEKIRREEKEEKIRREEKQGGHRPGKSGKPGIIREFETSGNIREMSGNFEENQGIRQHFPNIMLNCRFVHSTADLFVPTADSLNCTPFLFCSKSMINSQIQMPATLACGLENEGCRTSRR